MPRLPKRCVILIVFVLGLLAISAGAAGYHPGIGYTIRGPRLVLVKDPYVVYIPPGGPPCGTGIESWRDYGVCTVIRYYPY